jgi:hypothetical protein
LLTLFRKGDKIMTTRRMKITIWGFVVTLVITAWLLVSVKLIFAQENTMNYRISSYLVHMEVLPVGDGEGHIVFTFSRKGLAFLENGEVATFTNWGTQDATKGKGTFDFYSMLTFEDDSTAVTKGQGTAEPDPKGLLLFKGTTEFTKGTGRFEGIKGNLSFTGRSLTPYSKEKGLWSDAYFDVTGTYTLPSK